MTEGIYFGRHLVFGKQAESNKGKENNKTEEDEMKSKKLIAMVLLTFGFVFFITVTVSAAPAWYIVNVEKTGIGAGNYLVKVTDTAASPAFTGKWAKFTEAQEKSMLAVAMTAMSLGKTAFLQMDNALTVPVITAFYINE
jgi:hypothetical protein